jgi:16S rRNA (cytosine1402-N4)-methyltransferase
MVDSATPTPRLHKRRQRYGGKYPRSFREKYKEHAPEKYPETIRKVLESGKTPAGTHRPVMVSEVLEVLSPRPGKIVVDCTLGYGGHAQEILSRICPGGKLVGVDTDSIQLPRTEERLRGLGFDSEVFVAYRSNFAGLPQVLAREGLSGADIIFADLGVSSMQLDDPARGFSVKLEGPLDMRMNPLRGQPASLLLKGIKPDALAGLLFENADEPQAEVLGFALAGKSFLTTKSLVDGIRAALPRRPASDCEITIRRVFQALRIAVNDEFSALETFLRYIPMCLNPGGRVAILTFHSGEDRRVKKVFARGLRDGCYVNISQEVMRPAVAERNANPRSSSAKLRWAQKGE